MKKKTIIVLSDSGNIGKTFVSSLIYEALRLTTKVDGYTGDSKHQGFYERYGQRSKNGILIPIAQQNPQQGIGFWDIRDPSKKDSIGAYLNTTASHIVLDMPADSTTAVATCMGSPEELVALFEFDDSDLYFVPVIADEKSLRSAHTLQANFGGSAKYVVAINEGLMESRADKETLGKAMSDFGQVPNILLKQALAQRVFDEFRHNPIREAYTPRSERRQADGSINPGDDAYKIQNRADQFKLDRLLTDTTEAILKHLS